MRVEPGDWRRLTEALHDTHGYDLPPYIMPIGERQGISFRASGSGHDAEPASWLRALKASAGLYEELRRRGVQVDLFQREDPCEMRVLGEHGQPIDLSRLCRAALPQTAAQNLSALSAMGHTRQR